MEIPIPDFYLLRLTAVSTMPSSILTNIPISYPINYCWNWMKPFRYFESKWKWKIFERFNHVTIYSRLLLINLSCRGNCEPIYRISSTSWLGHFYAFARYKNCPLNAQVHGYPINNKHISIQQCDSWCTNSWNATLARTQHRVMEQFWRCQYWTLLRWAVPRYSKCKSSQTLFSSSAIMSFNSEQMLYLVSPSLVCHQASYFSQDFSVW